MTNNLVQLVKTLVKMYLEVKSVVDTIKQEVFKTVLDVVSELSVRKMLAESIYFQDDELEDEQGGKQRNQ